MPDFTIRGNPGAIRARATLTVEKATLFDDTGEALSKIDTSGWTGRAADNFRDAHSLEPDRWFKSGNGFRIAGSALLTYADAVEAAQATATWAEEEYARGDRATSEYRTWFDSESDRLRTGLANGTYSSITLPVWDDPGAAIRDNAVAEFNAARATLDNAAHVCAGEVRAGCADAPEEPSWWESGLRFVGGIFEGAGEALWDIATMLPFSPANLIQDAWKLATGDLTAEELMKTYELDLETVQGMWRALQDDPVEFGRNLGKGLLDWDTWADDPARAIGHLVPDAIAAVATGGAATAATRGAGSIDDIADGMRAIDRMADAGDMARLDDLGDVRHLDDLDDLSHLDLGDTPGFHPDGSINAEHFRTAPDSAYFWSGRTDGVGGAEVAARYADETHGTTLEQLMERRGVEMPEWDPDNPDVVRTWGDASAAYAQTASGEVRAVVGEDLRPGNVWETRELQSLIDNPEVTRIVRIDPKTGETEVLWP